MVLDLDVVSLSLSLSRNDCDRLYELRAIFYRTDDESHIQQTQHTLFPSFYLFFWAV